MLRLLIVIKMSLIFALKYYFLKEYMLRFIKYQNKSLLLIIILKKLKIMLIIKLKYNI